MKKIKFSLSILSTIFLSTIGFAQQVINQKVICPADLVEKVKKSPPGFYLDKSFKKEMKLGESFLAYVLIKGPGSGKEAKAIQNLEIHLPAVPDGQRIHSSSLDEFVDLYPGAKVTFANREYKAGETTCVEIKGVANKLGPYTAKVKLKSTVKVFFTINVKSTWSGLNFIVI